MTETFIKGKKGSDELCEDGIFLGQKLIVVIDGCTSKGSLQWNGTTSGKFAKDCIIEQLRESEVYASAASFFEKLSAVLREKRKLHPHCTREDWPRACVIAYSSVYRQVWSYGDCNCMINGSFHDHSKEIDRVLAERRAAVIEQAIQNYGVKETLKRLNEHDFARDVILPDLKRQLEFENRHLFLDGRDYGYPVINGEPICEDMMKIHDLQIGDEVIMATDGYPQLAPSLQESEKALQELISKDPFCFNINKSTKGLTQGNISFDDRAWVKLKVQ